MRLGTRIGDLTEKAAEAVGLAPGLPVTASLIDAHAGGVGTLGAAKGPGSALTRMAYVFGNSACTMSSAEQPCEVPGVWGPYFDAMLPGLWLNEGGQSAAGAGLDQLVRLHPAYASLGKTGGAALDALTDHALSVGVSAALARAARYTVVPDFNGNRAPLADPHARAVVAGLGMERDMASLVDLFVAGLMGLGHGLRHILDIQQGAGLKTQAIVVSGGVGASQLARHGLAETTRVPILVPSSSEPVLLGAAMLGAVASGDVEGLEDVIPRMSTVSGIIQPTATPPDWSARAYSRYRALQEATRLY